MIPTRVNIVGSTGIIKNNYLGENIFSKTFLGGTGFTIAHTLARLGGVNLRFIGATGAGGEVFRSQLSLIGVDVSHFSVHEDQPMPSGEVNTSTDGGQQWISFEDKVSRLLDARIFETVGGDELTILSPINRSAFVQIQDTLIRRGAIYMYDPGMMMHNLSDEQLFLGIHHAKFVIANQNEIQTIERRLGLGIEVLASSGRLVIQTLSGEGVRLVDGEIDKIVRVFPAESKDPTGAGDVWRAGFIFSLNSGSPVLECARFANALASISVEHYGAVDFPVDPFELQNRLNLIEHKNELR